MFLSLSLPLIIKFVKRLCICYYGYSSKSFLLGLLYSSGDISLSAPVETRKRKEVASAGNVNVIDVFHALLGVANVEGLFLGVINQFNA